MLENSSAIGINCIEEKDIALNIGLEILRLKENRNSRYLFDYLN